jgi:PrcB C-terminal
MEGEMSVRLRGARRALPAVLLLLVACGGPNPLTDPGVDGSPAEGAGVPLPFQTVVRGAAAGGTSDAAFLRVVEDPRERTAVAALLATSARAALEAVDLSGSVVIAAFHGLAPTSGFGIEVTDIRIVGRVLRVTVGLTSPTPGESVREGYETPYDLVRLNREAFIVAAPQTFRLIDSSGAPLDEGAIGTGSPGGTV